jgi:hypothetical protein
MLAKQRGKTHIGEASEVLKKHKNSTEQADG